MEKNQQWMILPTGSKHCFREDVFMNWLVLNSYIKSKKAQRQMQDFIQHLRNIFHLPEF
jgi:hypothetical protein